MKIAILILSAGSSKRMGTAKQLLPIGKTTLLGLCIENAIHSNAEKIFCVLGSNAEKIKHSISQYNVEIILNNNYEEGLSSSIIEGIKYINSENFDAVLIMLGDQPNVNTKYLNSLILSSEKHSSKIIASKYLDNIGVPAIFPKSYFEQLQKIKGDKGAKDFLNSNTSHVISIESDRLLDIDTKNDYLDYLKTL